MIGAEIQEPTIEEVVVPEGQGDVGAPTKPEDEFDPTAVLEGEIEPPAPEAVEPEEPKEPKEFDPDEIDLEDEVDEKYVFSEFNLDKFKDILDFDSEESRQIIGEKLSQLKDMGYSQEKVEGYVEALLELEKDRAPAVEDADTIKENLKAGLSREAKSNYKAIGAWFRDGVKGTEFEGKDYKDAMSNPKLVNVLNHLYKNYIANQGVKTKEVPNPQPKVAMDYLTAMQGIQDQLSKGVIGDELSNYAKGMLSKLSGEDLEQFKDSAKNVLKLNI